MSRTLLQRSIRSLHTPLPRHGGAAAAITTTPPRRHASDWSNLQSELPARKIPLVYDYLDPTPSHLLNIALADVMPAQGDPKGGASPRITPTTTNPTPLPPAHHLIYFPPAIPGKELLPDGTDPLQSPGEPFVRRMWAGGSVTFNNTPAGVRDLLIDGSRMACVESIRDVAVKGKEGDEKVFVGIERRVGRARSEDESDASIRSRLQRDAEEDFGESAVIERRNIVFMRERSKEQAVKDMEKAKTKQLSPPEEGADFEHTFTPNPKLLFRFSALTYNAHAIHLDPEYCRDVEGHKGLVVHGPLSFTMALTLLRMHLAKTVGKSEVIKSIEYRNLSPLYCDEPLTLAGRKKDEGKYEVWVVNENGGLALKGNVKTEKGDPREYGDLAMLGL